MTENFAVFILTNGRAKNVLTYKVIRKQGYTGRIFLIVDDEDPDLSKYQKKYKDEVIVFNKLAISKTFDIGDNTGDMNAVVFARNACWKIARDLGIDYFLQLDDDYTSFAYRFSYSNDFIFSPIKNLDGVFRLMIQWYKTTNALTVAFAQGGDLIGGQLAIKSMLKRKAMNTFFCATDRPITFIGRMNEDVTTYLTLGNRGDLFLTVFNISVHQRSTQSLAGGMSGTYGIEGTYIKTFSTIIHCPSFVKVMDMGEVHRRLHHRVNWECAMPKIISKKHRKIK